MRLLVKGIFPYLELCKLRISLFAAFSSACGFLLAAPGFRQQFLFLVAGVFALASGAGALNQYQERDLDKLMPRTEKRPLPSGRITPSNALCLSATLISLGLAVLSFAGSIRVPLLGLFAVLWYNGIYTYLKRKTAFAAVPGAIVGAVPPAMGSISGGGHIGDAGVLFLCFFFFVWQVPHFWLLIIDHGVEYGRAGLPSPMGIFTSSQMARIVFNWIIATSVSCLFIATVSAGPSLFMRSLILIFSLWLVWSGMRLLRRERTSSFAMVFKRINVYMFVVMTLLSINKLIT